MLSDDIGKMFINKVVNCFIIQAGYSSILFSAWKMPENECNESNKVSINEGY